MDTIIKKTSPAFDQPSDAEVIAQASAILKRGGLVAFPTETVYGLGGDGLLPSAAKKIYEAKGRPSDNPLIVHIADKQMVWELAQTVPASAQRLMDAFWPGPMTLILPKKDIVPSATTGGLDTVAIRCPSHPVARALITQSGICIAAPSANRSGRPSPTKAEHVIEDLNGRIDMIIDSGAVEIGLESTIIDVTGEIATILRPGYVTQKMILTVLDEVAVDPAILEEHANENLVAKAPGMKYKHYAPKGALTLVEGADLTVVSAKINELVAQDVAAGKKAAVIATQESKARYQAPIVLTMGCRSDSASVAHECFSILREMDTLGVDVIYCESFEREALGQAIMNRLLKAAGYRVLRL